MAYESEKILLNFGWLPF